MSFFPSRRIIPSIFPFFPSWNIDLRARPWALWNFLRSTSPLTHRCRNIIPPARYFNLALSTRQGPEKKKFYLYFSLSLCVFLFLFSFSFILSIFRGRLDASDSSRTSPQETWMENGNNSLPDRQSDVCECVYLCGTESRDEYVRGIVSSRRVHRYFGITFSWKTRR